MANKKDSGQQELFARQEKLKDEAKSLMEMSDQLNQDLANLRMKREMLGLDMRKIEEEIKVNNAKIDELQVQLTKTNMTRYVLEEKIKATPEARRE